MRPRRGQAQDPVLVVGRQRPHPPARLAAGRLDLPGRDQPQPEQRGPRQQPDAGVQVVAAVRLGEHRQRGPDRQRDRAPFVGELDDPSRGGCGGAERRRAGDGDEAHTSKLAGAADSPDRRAYDRSGEHSRRKDRPPRRHAHDSRRDHRGPAGAAGQRRQQVRADPAVRRARGAPGDVRRRRVHGGRAAVQPVLRAGARQRRGDRGVLLGDVRRDLPDDREDRRQRRRPARDLPRRWSSSPTRRARPAT